MVCMMREAYVLTKAASQKVDMVELFPDSKDYSQVFAEHSISAFDPATLPDYSDKE